MTAPSERTFSVGSDVRDSTSQEVLSKSDGLVAYKDKDENCDYTLDWSSRLEEDETIEASDWLLPVPPNAELAVYQGLVSFEEQKTTVWLTGGVDGRSYRIVNRVLTSGERTLDCSLTIKMVER